MVAFQSPKRKEKQGNLGNGLALHQREIDTRTTTRISSETIHIRTIKTPTKTKSHRALMLSLLYSPLEGKHTITATTPLGIHRPP
jgi:hypothetical protein